MPSEKLPDHILGYVSVRANAGPSVLQYDDISDLKRFRASREQRAQAEKEIRRRGFEVKAASDFGFSLVGSAEQWFALGGEAEERGLVTFEQKLYTRVGRLKSVTHIGFEGRVGPVTGRIPPTSDAGRFFDAVVIERPRTAQDSPSLPAPDPPPIERFHLRVPEDVATILGADQVHAQGHRGDGVTVAMVDTGHYAHPFFAKRRYKVAPVRTVIPDTDPEQDRHGHGTGESANLFAVAPGATLLPIRAANDKGDFVGGLAGFMLAKTLLLEQHAHRSAAEKDQPPKGIISNSWGGDYTAYPRVPGLPNPADRMLELEIRDAIENGIVVVFAAGNGTFGMEAQVPGVISAGGVFAGEGWQLQATPYASGYRSPWYEVGGQATTVPTVCGLVGLPPRASYLMLPIPPDCRIDPERAAAGRGDPADGTEPHDGWALFSGTSAAAPQVAGAAAVLLGLQPGSTPAEIAGVLRDTALDVRLGRCHPRFNHEATEGWDLATGAGLINLPAAVARWNPAPSENVSGPIPDGLTEGLSHTGLMDRFLHLLATDDAFRTAFSEDPKTTLSKWLGFEGNFDLEGPLRLSPKRICAAALRDFQDGEPFDASDETYRLTFMLA